MRLLGLAYDPSQPLSAVKAEADRSGGYPLAVLKARYALKRSLRTDEGVPFSEIPEKPNLDWGPLPLYECGRMGEGKEEKAFETWMLSDLTLCKDIAEFAAFALALRGGAWKQAAPVVERPSPRPERAERAERDDFEPENTGPNLVVIGGVAAVALLIVAGASAWFLM